jgi:UDP-sulfoquinovose synthase
MGNKEAWKTLENNLHATLNLIWCVKNLNKNCHIIKLGTMGEYGTPNIDIEEGWIDVKHNKRHQKFLYPRQASSLYHTSKIMDTDLLWFYARTNGIRVTDLMQGPVYGILDNKFIDDNNLQTSFAYDDMFGTVLNRFIVQAIAKTPLLVYGSGNQIRGYINIKDTLNCINLTLNNKPKQGSLNIYNQFTEQFSVNELAKKVKKALTKININATIKKIKNPRIEKEKHYYNAKNDNMIKLGLKPTLLNDDVIIAIAKHIIKYKKNINKSVLKPKTKWA